MDDFLIEIVRNKAFNELSVSEKLLLKEWCEGEDEFNQLKLLFIEIEALKVDNDIILDPNVKNGLDGLFYTEHRTQRRFLLNLSSLLYKKEEKWYRQPLAHIAAIMVIMFTVFNTLKLKQNDSMQLAQNNKTHTKTDKEVQNKQSEQNENPSDVREMAKKISSVIDQNKADVPEKVAIDAVEMNDEVADFEMNIEAVPGYNTINEIEGLSPSEQPFTTFHGEAKNVSSIENYKNLNTDDASTMFFDVKVTKALSDNVAYQVKPVSTQLLEVLYTMY
jgi:hypothetical protein